MIDQEKDISLYREGLTQKEGAQRLGTTRGYGSMSLSGHDVDTGFTKWWEDDEIEFLKNNYPPDSEEEMEKLVEKCVSKEEHGRV